MYKRLSISAALLAAALAIGPVPAAGGVTPDQQYETVREQGEQTDVQGDWVPSEETNTVQESEMTRKAIQAEKARNAAENDKFGGAVTIIAMCIVISALVILSLLFLGFGKISTALQRKRKRLAHGVTEESAEEHHDEVDTGDTIAAIAMALAEHLGHGHDLEDTKLTIRRLRKAYSPWNSKIYNLRHVPSMPGHHPKHV